MLRVVLEGHDNYYGIADVIRLFYGPAREVREEQSVVCETGPDLEIISRVSEGEVSTFIKGQYTPAAGLDKIPLKREVKRDLYIILSRISGRSFPWGSLTGIRPTVVANEVGRDPSKMVRDYLVRKDKAEIACITAQAEEETLRRVPAELMNIYVGVPFCPSRCEYCSFISSDAVKHLSRLKPYEKALEKEIGLLSEGMKRSVGTIYLGGGTPTVFEDKLFGELMETISLKIGKAPGAEFTVEAGRPDTITGYKLDAMREAGVTRVCINPQTMKTQTLTKLNRRHSSEDIVRSYELARKKGFEAINMDLIAGLKYETAEDLLYSLGKVIELDPENITIHTLYKKRRADISREDVLREDGAVDDAVSRSYDLLREAGYFPYYMYRQKDTGYGLENIGFSKKGYECLYNVAMMTDRRDVLSIGAGGVSKRIFDNNRFERLPCVKDVLMYIKDVEDISRRKLDFWERNI